MITASVTLDPILTCYGYFTDPILYPFRAEDNGKDITYTYRE